MNILKKINYGFYKASKEVGTLMLLVMVVAITVSIIARYFFNHPFTWTEELCTFLFIGFAFFGATVATYEKRHVSVDILVEKLPETANKIIKLVANLIVLAFFVLLTVGSFVLFPTMTHKSVAPHIPKWAYYVPIMLSSAMMFCMYLLDTIELVLGWKNGKEETK